MEKLQGIIQSNPTLLEPIFTEANTYLSTKRWYELGQKIQEILTIPVLRGKYLFIFDNFVRLFFEALDPFQRAKIILSVSEELDIQNCLQFLKQSLEKYFEKIPEPATLIKLRIVFCHTQLGEFETALNQLIQIEDTITEKTDLYVRSQFHRTQADLDKARGDFDSYYEHALYYLSTAKDNSNQVIAYDLCMSALFSISVCSFGELASHKILDSLVGTPNEWLRNLILLLNKGEPSSIPEFNEKFMPIIAANETFNQFKVPIQQKIALSVFLQLIFARPFESRIFSFEEISRECHVPLDRVEILVMKALSTELIRGEIDEVDQKLTVTWCKPKALDLQRLKHLKFEIDRWCDKVHNQMFALSQRAQPVVG